jgi:hypothetical protein
MRLGTISRRELRDLELAVVSLTGPTGGFRESQAFDDVRGVFCDTLDDGCRTYLRPLLLTRR